MLESQSPLATKVWLINIACYLQSAVHRAIQVCATRLVESTMLLTITHYLTFAGFVILGVTGEQLNRHKNAQQYLLIVV